MINFRTNHKKIGTEESPVFTLAGPNAEGLTVFLLNHDPANYINYRMRSSADGVTYADIVEDVSNTAVTGILPPGGKVMVSIRTGATFVRLSASASGIDADLDYSIVQFTPAGSLFSNGVLS